VAPKEALKIEKGGAQGSLKEQKGGTQERLKEKKGGAQERLKEKKGGAQESLKKNGEWPREPHSGLNMCSDSDSDKKIPKQFQKSLILFPSPSTLHHHTSPNVGLSPGETASQAILASQGCIPDLPGSSDVGEPVRSVLASGPARSVLASGPAKRSATGRPPSTRPNTTSSSAASSKGSGSGAHAERLLPILCFWDYAAAFPSVSHVFMLLVLSLSQAPRGFINIVEGMYAHNAAFAACEGVTQLAFWVFSGVLQGCPLSGILFTFVIDPFLRCMKASIQDKGLAQIRACYSSRSSRQQPRQQIYI
jgi:hypothetical protein